MPYVTMYRASEEIAEISDLQVGDDARVRLTDNEWGWCPVADLVRLGLLPPKRTGLGDLSGIAEVLAGPAPEAGGRDA